MQPPAGGLPSCSAWLQPHLVVPAPARRPPNAGPGHPDQQHLQASLQCQAGMAGTVAGLDILLRSNGAEPSMQGREHARAFPAHAACSRDCKTSQHACKQRPTVISGLWASGSGLKIAQHSTACSLRVARNWPTERELANTMQAATVAGCTSTPAGRDGRPGALRLLFRPPQRSRPAAARPGQAHSGSRRVQRPGQARARAPAAAPAAAETAPPLSAQLDLGNLQVAAEFVFTVPGLCTLRARDSLEGERGAERGACCSCCCASAVRPGCFCRLLR